MSVTVQRRSALAAVIAVLAAAGLPGCSWLPRPAIAPMPTVRDTGACGPADTVVVLLPGRGMFLDELSTEGFIGSFHSAGLRANLIRADAHLGYYKDRSVVDRLRADVIEPARAQGYRHVWLAGISLGGLGALLYADEHPDEIDGLLLIAPYLGEPQTAADVAAQGGPAQWRPPVQTDDAIGVRAWTCLQRYVGPTAGRTPLFLAFGEDDRLAPTHQVLAAALPRQRVLTARGGHDWPAWRPLWQRLLAQAPLPHCIETRP